MPTPKEYQDEIDAIRSTKQSVEDSLEEKQLQALSIIQSDLSDLIDSIKADANIDKSYEIVRKRSMSRFELKIIVDASDFVNKGGGSRLLKDAGDVFDASGLPKGRNPVQEES